MKSTIDKTEVQDLLLACLARQDKIAARPLLGRGCFLSFIEADAVLRQHGPRYSAAKWFEATEPAEKKRYGRAVEQCESDGWLTIWRQWGEYISHVQLTPAGLAVARELAAQQEGQETD